MSSYTTNPHLPRVRMQAVSLVKNNGWSIRKTARHLGFHHTTVMRWLKKAPRDTRQLIIPTKSSRPHSHPHELSQDIVSKIVELRLKRNRCSEVVHQEMIDLGYMVSLSSVKRTLERNCLINKRSPWKRYHPYQERPKAFKPGDLVEIDTIHIGPHKPNRLYIYTILDVFSWWAWADVCFKINPGHSIKFVQNVLRKAPFQLKTLQSDHGQEFSSYFTEHIQLKDITHRHIRVRKPNDNGHLERFNRTIQEECLKLVPERFNTYKREIPKYLNYYNNERLHLGLNFKTPSQMVTSY